MDSSEFFRRVLMCNILGKIFWTVVLIFIVLNILVTVTSGLPQVSLVYLGIEMIQSEKSFFEFVDQTRPW